jgi:FkbM family methyltransferase
VKELRRYLAFNESYLELWWRQLDSISVSELERFQVEAFGKLDTESRGLIQTHLKLVAATKPSPLDPYLFVQSSAQEEIFHESLRKRWAAMGYSDDFVRNLDVAQAKLGLDQPPGSEFLLDYGLAPIRRVTAEYLAAGNALDVGAGDGVATWVFVTKYGVRKSFCFEPQQTARVNILDNIRRWQLEDRVIVSAKAAGSTEERAILHGSGAGATLIGPKRGSDQTQQVVDVVTLDNWKKKTTPGQISLLKVDCEGNENSVMAGAFELVATDQPVLLIALYHTPDALFEMLPRLLSEHPRYKWQVRKTGPELVKELTLVGIPPELNKLATVESRLRMASR